jgi:hypothetical protein
MQFLPPPLQLSRCLTSHKIGYAHALLDDLQAESGVVSQRYMIEMHLKRGDNNNDPTSIWHVHYIRVLNDGERLMEQDDFCGTFDQVYNTFIPLRALF